MFVALGVEILERHNKTKPHKRRYFASFSRMNVKKTYVQGQGIAKETMGR